ncbi:MAG: Bro-N domain-containing protein [bacterium]|nr:Bro-N domain-containing protein [bacterium]
MTINNTSENENQSKLDAHPHMISIMTIHNCFGPGKIRVLRRDNVLWVVAKDFTNILGYSDTSAMIRHLDPDESMSVKSAGMKMPHIVIKEAGLYSVITRSNLKYPNEFKSWVTHHIFSSMRQSDLQRLRLAEQQMEKAIKEINLKNQEIEYFRWQLEDSNTWKLVRSISWLKDFFNVDQRGCNQRIGKVLSYASRRLGLNPRKIAHPKLRAVNIYHEKVIQHFHRHLIENPNYMKQIRK